MINSCFNQLEAIVVSKHHKIDLFQAVLNDLGLVLKNAAFDTDTLGTFSGEIERPAPQIETLLMKAQKGFALGKAVLASEGAFVPHPNMPTLTLNIERVCFLYPEQNIEIVGNYAQIFETAWIKHPENIAALNQCLSQIDFPNNGVIVKYGKNSEHILKDLSTTQEIVNLFNESKSKALQFSIETDLRAHRNAERRHNILKAIEDLKAKMLNNCPVCKTPGFSVTEERPGKKCGLCNMPTALIGFHILECKHCAHSETIVLNDYADPINCTYCNP